MSEVVMRTSEYTGIYRKRSELCLRIIALDVEKQRTATLIQAEMHLVSREKKKFIEQYAARVTEQEEKFSVERLALLNEINKSINELDVPSAHMSELTQRHSALSAQIRELQHELMRVQFPPRVILIDAQGGFVCRITNTPTD